MKTHVYRGAVIEESLDDRAVLVSLKTLHVAETGEADPAARCRVRTVEGSREALRALSRHLKPVGWHAQFWDSRQNTMIVFRGRVFEFRLADRRAWGEAIRHGLEVGVPRERLGSPA